MKTVLFVPGFQENKRSRNYYKTIKAIEKCGYNAMFVPIQWKRTTIVQWVGELDKIYSKFDLKQIVLSVFLMEP